MIGLEYLFGLSIALFAIGLAGIAADRHLIVILLAVELILVASTIGLVAFYSSGAADGPDAVLMLFAIFSVAAVEVMAAITFYIYMKRYGIDFDVAKLSKMKW